MAEGEEVAPKQRATRKDKGVPRGRRSKAGGATGRMGPVSLARLVCGGERQVSAAKTTKWRAWGEVGRPGGHGP